MCAVRIREDSLPVAHHLLCGSIHRHHLPYPFINLGAELTVCLWGGYSAKPMTIDVAGKSRLDVSKHGRVPIVSLETGYFSSSFTQ